jgi:hypothetical protein
VLGLQVSLPFPCSPPYESDTHLSPTPYESDTHLSPTPYKSDAHLSLLLSPSASRLPARSLASARWARGVPEVRRPDRPAGAGGVARGADPAHLPLVSCDRGLGPPSGPARGRGDRVRGRGAAGPGCDGARARGARRGARASRGVSREPPARAAYEREVRAHGAVPAPCAAWQRIFGRSSAADRGRGAEIFGRRFASGREAVEERSIAAHLAAEAGAAGAAGAAAGAAGAAPADGPDAGGGKRGWGGRPARVACNPAGSSLNWAAGDERPEVTIGASGLRMGAAPPAALQTSTSKEGGGVT